MINETTTKETLVIRYDILLAFFSRINLNYFFKISNILSTLSFNKK